jgi:hypothetical protein
MADLPPQQPPTGGYGGPPFGSQEEPLGVHEVKGFFGSLFDFSFRSFITGRLIRVLYVLAMIGLALWTLGWLASALVSQDGGLIVLGLVGAPLAFLFGLIYIRVLLELIIVIFRIGDDVRSIAASNRDRPPPA